MREIIVLSFLLITLTCHGQPKPHRFHNFRIPETDAFTATRLGDYPFTSVDSRHGDTLNGYFYAMGGVTGEPQVSNRDIVRYNHGTDTWDSIGQMPFDCSECFIKTMNNRMYLIRCRTDTLWKYDGTNFTVVATGLTFTEDICFFNFGVTANDLFIIQGGSYATHPDSFVSLVTVFDTLGVIDTTWDAAFFNRSYANGNMPLFQNKLPINSGGQPYTESQNNYGYISGATWTEVGTTPLETWWSDIERINDDYLLMCCGVSDLAGDIDVATTFITSNLITWESFTPGWEKRHAGTMWNYNDVLYFAFGRCQDCNTPTTNYSIQVWKVEYTP